MKVVNTIRLKEEVDYESLYKKVESEVDHLTSEIERQQKLKHNEKIQLEERLKESETFLNDLRMTSAMQIEVYDVHINFALYMLISLLTL
jgi:kinesin family protein 5